MRVAELTAFQVHIPLKKPIRHASHARTSTDNLVVRCVLTDGTEGYGEGVPREYVTGETIDSTIALLKRSDVPSQLSDCRDFAEAVALAESVRTAEIPGDDRRCQGNAARCALELALLDAYGKHFGQPLSAVTNVAAPELFQRRERVQYSGAITSTRGMKLRFAAWKYRIFGFHQMKLKVGIAGYDDVKRLKIIRRRMGKVDLRVDVNEAWSPAETAQRIQELETIGITSVEQPLAHDHIFCLAEVRRQVRTPIMLDESLCGMVDAERARDGGLCDLFNLRLSKCGGYLPSLRLAQFARQNGLGCQLGCQVGETALLSAAGRHFACSVGGLRYLEGSYDRHLVLEALGTNDITFGWGGWAPVLTGPGLGITIDQAALQRVTTRKEPLLG
jgi:muconate cycloisomerase